MPTVRVCQRNMASAALLHGDRDRAFAELQRARRITPEQTRYHPGVREVLATISQTDRCRTDSLSAYARWIGLQL